MKPKWEDFKIEQNKEQKWENSQILENRNIRKQKDERKTEYR